MIRICELNYEAVVKDEQRRGEIAELLAQLKPSFRRKNYISIVISIGSILECVLVDFCLRHEREIRIALARKGEKCKTSVQKMNLEDLIGMVYKVEYFDQELNERCDEVRKARNSVHIERKIRKEIEMNAKKVLDFFETLKQAIKALMTKEKTMETDKTKDSDQPEKGEEWDYDEMQILEEIFQMPSRLSPLLHFINEIIEAFKGKLSVTEIEELHDIYRNDTRFFLLHIEKVVPAEECRRIIDLMDAKFTVSDYEYVAQVVEKYQNQLIPGECLYGQLLLVGRALNAYAYELKRTTSVSPNRKASIACLLLMQAMKFRYFAMKLGC